ncbi:glycosyltransferase family 2 protein [Paenibacillus ginsengarvi]|uniref:Glycosyltransferase family 2 protein n=1 Tax=Paenibacillus ginsengarvi TaxID=400777 RepID=A0A3B0CGI6_9BACL|nr:glycosyltransferase family 2 protein [Paenibacillus ginsengarvi]RKN82176.1 glycosyltransferase family 2 protein [Paenibacillus ginsengarvi]
MAHEVSVHIVSFNSEDYIQACLDSVLEQTYPISQIIVIDNASSDRTRIILGKFQNKIEVIVNSVNTGFAQAHNQAIHASNSNYYLVLNPDVILDREFVAKLVEVMMCHSNVGSVTGKLIRSQRQEIIDSTGLIINRARRAFDRGENQCAVKWKDKAEVFGVSGAAAFYRRTMVEEVSIEGEFFDEDFFAYKEDVDVAWRAQLLGWKAYYEPEAIAIHERGWKSGSRKRQHIFVRRLSYINRYKMLVKNDRIVYVIRHLMPIIWYEILSFGYVIFKEPLLLPIWIDFWTKIPKMLKKRKWIKSRQKASNSNVYKWFND